MIAVASSYTPNMGYQENLLSKAFVDKGHEVIILSNDSYYKDGVLIKTDENNFYDDKIFVIRKRYIKIFNDYISSKIRAVKNLKKLLIDINPDIIFHHGLATYAMLEINKYCRLKKIHYLVDSHEDLNNSARNVISKLFLHSIFYRLIIKKSDKYIKKYYFISYESKKFIEKYYRVNPKKTEYLPLGFYNYNDGLILHNIRLEIRKKHSINTDDIVFIHSGKIDESKRTDRIINAFVNTKIQSFKLIIIGRIIDNNYEKMIKNKSIDDSRIMFFDWMNSDMLYNYMIASDVYLQPGTQSSSFHLAANAKNLLVSSRNKSYEELYFDSIIYLDKDYSLEDLFRELSLSNEILSKRFKSEKIAKEILDYSSQVDKILREYCEKIN